MLKQLLHVLLVVLVLLVIYYVAGKFVDDGKILSIIGLILFLILIIAVLEIFNLTHLLALA